MKKLLIVVGLLILGVGDPQVSHAFSSKELLIFFGFGGDDHAKINTTILANLPAGYPDLAKFGSVLIEAGSNEGIQGLGSHKSPDNSVTYWYGNDGLWDTAARQNYFALDYQDAYQALGFEGHILQDARVPAHDKVDFHGVSSDYTLSPEDNGIYIFGTSHLDGFEEYASNNHQDQIAPTLATYDNIVTDPLTGCPEKFWLAGDETAPPATSPSGTYGEPTIPLFGSVQCQYPFYQPQAGQGQDWFGLIGTSTNVLSIQQATSNGQLYQARKDTIEAWTTLSSELPPNPSELSIAGAGVGGAPAIIDTTNGSPITFRISENRSQINNVNVYVQDTNQSIITSGDYVTLSSFRSADGLTDSTNLPGPNTWSNQPVSLFGTLLTDLTLLPFDGQFQLNWNGKVVGTTPLSSGTHTLCVSATDGDGNTSQSVCGNFTVDGLALKVYQDALQYASSGDIGSDIGATDPLNGITDGNQIVVDASDLLVNGSSEANISGLFVYQGASTGILIGSNTQTFGSDKKYSSADTGLSILSQLPGGDITLVAYDMLGGSTTLTLTVDTGTFAIRNANQNVVADQGATNTTTVFVDVPAGTAQLTIDGPSTFDPTTFQPGESITYDAEYDDLSDGLYTLTALNSEGVMVSSMNFTIDTIPPTLSVTDNNNTAIQNIADTASPVIFLSVTDAGSGVAEINFPGFDPYELNGTTGTTTIEFDNVDPGQNVVTVTDLAGNVSTFTFTETNVLPVISLASNGGATGSANTGVGGGGSTLNYFLVTGTSAPPGFDVAPDTVIASILIAGTPDDSAQLSITSVGALCGGSSLSMTCIPALPLPPDATAATCTLYVPNPGGCSFSVSNASGTSTISWRAVALSVALDTGSTNVSVNGAEFQANLALAVNADLGIHNIMSYEVSTPNQIDSRLTPSYSGLPDLTQLTTSFYTRNFTVTDNQGDQAQIQTSFGNIFAIFSSTTQFGSAPLCADGTDYCPSISTAGYDIVEGPGIYNASGEIDLTTGVNLFSNMLINQPFTDSRSGVLIDSTSYPGLSFSISTSGFGGYFTATNVPIGANVPYVGSETVFAAGHQIASMQFSQDPATGLFTVGSLTRSPGMYGVDPTVPLAYTLNLAAPTSISSENCVNGTDPGDPTVCSKVQLAFPNFTFEILFAQAMITPGGAPSNLVEVYPGAGQTIPIGLGASVTGLTAASTGTIRLTATNGGTVYNTGGGAYTDVNAGVAYTIVAQPLGSAPFPSGGFNLNIPFKNQVPTDLTPHFVHPECYCV